MRILYISQYYHPETGATTNRTEAIAKAMLESGHRVTILSEMPNHPQGVIFPAYKGRFLCHESVDGIPVIHLPVIASPKKNFLTRVLMYLSFSISACSYLLLKRPRYDLLYITSPPLFSALTGLLSKLIFPRRKVVFEVRDLWPDSAIEFGELKSSALIRLSLWLENQIYQRSDLVVGATRYIGRAITAKGVAPRKIIVSFNGVDQDVLDSYVERQPFSEEHLFTAVFAGNMGLAYQLEPILDCALLMQDEKIRFLFVGGGPAKAGLIDKAQKLKLPNVDFMDPTPRSNMGKILAATDCGIFILKDNKVMSGALPVKMFDYMAFKLPMVAGVKGEAAEVMNESQAGILVEQNDPGTIATALRRLMADSELAHKLGGQGRAYVLQHYQRSALARELVHEINSRFLDK